MFDEEQPFDAARRTKDVDTAIALLEKHFALVIVITGHGHDGSEMIAGHGRGAKECAGYALAAASEFIRGDRENAIIDDQGVGYGRSVRDIMNKKKNDGPLMS